MQPSTTSLVMLRPDLAALPGMGPLPAGYELRTYAGERDLLPLAGVLSSAFAVEWTEALVRERLTEAADVQAVHVVAWRGEPVATASCRSLPERFPGAGYVHWVGTHQSHLRHGLSAALMARVLADFAQRGDQTAVLETDDFRLPAIRMYLRFGFTPVYEVAGEDHRRRWSAIFSGDVCVIRAGTTEPGTAEPL